VEGLNNKAKVTMRESYGFRTFRITELALYHALGKLPESELTYEFYRQINLSSQSWSRRPSPGPPFPDLPVKPAPATVAGLIISDTQEVNSVS